ncbi:MAG: molybdopterin oxidoreductase family protein [Candidatus Nanopelagicales bacterium]|nr:molybdopterin oxidoreductase family protein [Candidatus Nanopelagicales bacterium]
MTAVDTHCPYCSLQCAMTLTPSGAAQGIPTVSGREFPTNRGGMCQKGWSSAAVLAASDRLTSPMVRDRAGQLRPASWDSALSVVAAGLQDIQRRHGAASVAVFGSGGLTNEKAYSLGKFARAVLGTPNIDYNGRFCMSSAAAAVNRAFGLDRGLPFPLTDLNGAQAVLLAGSNMAETMPPAVAHLGAVRAAGGLVVIDPRRTPTAALCDEGAGLHLAPVPGTDLIVLLSILQVVFSLGLADEHYLRTRTTGADAVRAAAGYWWPERAEGLCGVPTDEIRRAAAILAAGSPAHGGHGTVILTGRGVEQGIRGTDTVTAAINLALALGLPGQPNSGYGPITGQGNGQGGREHGQKCDQLPGYRSIEDPAAREHVAGVWGVDPSALPGPGLPAVELLSAIGTDQGPRALLIHGSNPAVSAPDSQAVVERLRALELLVVCDFVPSETSQLAHVVLPVTQWAEEEGTVTSVEGRILRRRQAVDPPPGVRSELEILADLAGRLGSQVAFDTSADAVFDELARASAGGRADYSGLSHALLDEESAQFWPVPANGVSTPRLFAERFATTDGRARMVAVDAGNPTTGPDISLVTGRVLQHYQTGAQTRRVTVLDKAVPEPYVQVHPTLAQRLNIAEGDIVDVRSPRGTARARARLSVNIRPDTLFMPFHWGGSGCVNRVTEDVCDPVSGMPAFKLTDVTVTPALGQVC